MCAENFMVVFPNEWRDSSSVNNQESVATAKAMAPTAKAPRHIETKDNTRTLQCMVNKKVPCYHYTCSLFIVVRNKC